MKKLFLAICLILPTCLICTTLIDAPPIIVLPNEPKEITPPYGLPSIPWPRDNPYTPEKSALGKLLYFDTRLSTDGTVSCASCHSPTEAFSDRRPLSIGIDRQIGIRHSITIINSAYQPVLFWDGRSKNLEEQSLIPIMNRKEMTLYNNPHLAYKDCLERIKKIKGYTPLFKQVFGTENYNLEDVAKAIATFERTILSGNSKYDHFIIGKEEVFNDEEKRGYQIFLKKGCMDCHHGVNFSNGLFTNIGVGMNKPNPDPGRYAVTKDEKDFGAFKVPILRDIAKTHPYMHDGSLKTLEEVIDYYDKGGIANEHLHPLMVPLNLSPQEKKDLISFLKTLNGDGWQNIKEPSIFPE